MSQLLLRLSKLSSRNNVLMHRNVRLLSTSPYLTIGTRVKEVLSDGYKIEDVLLFDPAKEELVTLTDKKTPSELYDHEMIGASSGWGFYSSYVDSTIRISDLFNPLASKSNPTVLTLPHKLTPVPSTQTEIVRNLVMSSSDPHHEDCVVAIKFSGQRLSLYRPGHDYLDWTNILTPFHCLENSNLMYSKRDQRFYLPAPGGDYLFSYDRHSKEDENPYLQELVYRVRPELDQSEWELLSSCTRTEYLVKSPSTGERYLVKWYSRGYSSSTKISQESIRFLVFKEEETMQGKFMCYTEDIEDMCIFLGSQAFCIPASSCQGLKPNTIYFEGRGLGYHNLTTGDACHYRAPPGAPTTLSTSTFWLPPFSI